MLDYDEFESEAKAERIARFKNLTLLTFAFACIIVALFLLKNVYNTHLVEMQDI